MPACLFPIWSESDGPAGVGGVFDEVAKSHEWEDRGKEGESTGSVHAACSSETLQLRWSTSRGEMEEGGKTTRSLATGERPYEMSGRYGKTVRVRGGRKRRKGRNKEEKKILIIRITMEME